MLGKNGGTLNQKYEKAREMEYIEREHLRTLFTHFKTNTKTIGIYRVLGWCALL